VIQEIYRRYGKHGAAMTANVITYRGRSAAREIGKALNFAPNILDRFSHLFANGDFPHTLDLQSQIEQSGFRREHPRMPAFVRLYQMIYGLPRPSRAALRRNDYLSEPAEQNRAAGERLNARPGRRAVGQGRLRRPRES
jgi:hypothetical protein